MAESLEEVVHDESARAIDRQSRAVDECRNRAAVVLAANGVTAGILATIASDNGIGPLGYVAVAVTAVRALLATRILMPVRNAWTFAASATILLEDHADVEVRNELKAFYRFRALQMERHFDTNQGRLDGQYWWLTAACLACALDIALWLGEIAFT